MPTGSSRASPPTGSPGSPRSAARSVESNHPAFIYGHLSLYAPQILQPDRRTPPPPCPTHFEIRFSKDAKCIDDRDVDLYPPMDEIVTFFLEGHRMVTGPSAARPTTSFQQPNPAEGRMKELFPTLGSVQTFYCGGHMMMHLGQMSAWRRMQGLGAA